MRVETSDRPTRPVLGIAISLGLLTIIGLAEVASDQGGQGDLGILVAVVLLVLISGLLVAKRPDHPISWLMALTALLGAVAAVSARGEGRSGERGGRMAGGGFQDHAAGSRRGLGKRA